MAAKTYKWCNLKNGDKHTCGYIETRGAVKGYHVEMLDLDGEKWEVTSVSGDEVSKDFVNENKRKVKSFAALEHTDTIVRRVGV